MPSHTKHSIICSVSPHHPEHIFCKITESWKFQSVSPQLEHVTTPLYLKLFAAFLAHVTHALGQHSETDMKDFLSRM